MVLRRLGNKRKIAHKIITEFPRHTCYVEPFFGAGGIFFNKPKAKYNVVNDLDSDVFNLFQVIINQKEELKKAFYIMPIHKDLLAYWKKNKETDPIKKALRFLFLSNFTFLGQSATLRFALTDPKKIFYERIDNTFDKLTDVEFNNCDFKDFFDAISFRSIQDIQKAFIYCDPPYLDTTNNYSDGFTYADSLQLFDTLEKAGVKWAMSEFEHPFIIEQVKQRGLNVIKIGERQNLNNRKIEILITNYRKQQMQLW